MQRISGAVDLFAILTQSKACLFKLFGRNEVVGIEFVGTVEVGLRLLDVHLGEANATFGSIDLRHFGDDLYFGNHFAFLHHLSRFLVEFGDDAGDLRFDGYFVARFDRAGHDGGAADGFGLCGEEFVLCFLRL